MKLALSVAGAAAILAAGAGCGGGRAEPAPTTVTFHRDVEPILHANCARCHRPGEAAPFSLLTYADASGRADEIAQQTQARHMPPWLPEPGEFAFHGDRRLRADQIATLQRWAAAGAPEGNPADAPKPPVFPAGWQSGTPDLVLTPERAYAVKAGSGDTYRNLVVRTKLTAGAFVRAVEFKTNGAPIHHAVIRVDRTSSSRRRDGEDGLPGFDGMNWQPGQDPDGHFIGWAPGSGPIASPEGMPWRIERGDDLVIEVHAIPTDKALTIQPTVGLFFTPTPPVQSPLTVRMGVKLIDIPAGQADYAVDRHLGTTGGGDAAQHLSACALPRQRDGRHRDAARRCDADADSHQAMELPLAAGVPFRHASAVAARHGVVAALHLRQLGAERRESASSAAARARRAEVD